MPKGSTGNKAVPAKRKRTAAELEEDEEESPAAHQAPDNIFADDAAETQDAMIHQELMASVTQKQQGAITSPSTSHGFC
jgi:hypothetical protein